MTRQAIPLSPDFFNDGHWYVLTSTSLGGTSLGIPELVQRLQGSEDFEPFESIAAMNDLLGRGICLPLFFDGDCALDDAIVVVGDLSPEEEAQWLGRVRSKLEIPCGEFVVMGGAIAEDVEEMTQNFTPRNQNFQFFQKFKVEPGTYEVVVYAFMGSLTANELWGEWVDRDHLDSTALSLADEEIDQWWHRTRPDQDPPNWVRSAQAEGYVDGEADNLLSYIIQLKPATEPIPVPPLEASTHWCGVFEWRKPALCPQGIDRSTYTAFTG